MRKTAFKNFEGVWSACPIYMIPLSKVFLTHLNIYFLLKSELAANQIVRNTDVSRNLRVILRFKIYNSRIYITILPWRLQERISLEIFLFNFQVFWEFLLSTDWNTRNTVRTLNDQSSPSYAETCQLICKEFSWN